MDLERARIDSPVGPLDLLVASHGVVALEFEGRGDAAKMPISTSLGLDGRRAVDLLRAYFDGDLDALARIPVAPKGTPFQLRVWEALRTIGVGETLSYRGLAERIGQPRAIRAVALCNARNPVAIAIPCHRVIGSDGTLVGYGGGLERKQWLLEHEGALPRRLAVAK
jgi:methylated-DNA-[protein]-cysteine S-methyltransferase